MKKKPKLRVLPKTPEETEAQMIMRLMTDTSAGETFSAYLFSDKFEVTPKKFIQILNLLDPGDTVHKIYATLDPAQSYLVSGENILNTQKSCIRAIKILTDLYSALYDYASLLAAYVPNSERSVIFSHQFTLQDILTAIYSQAVPPESDLQQIK